MTFGVPVAFVLVYNFVSLIRTIVATKESRKVSVSTIDTRKGNSDLLVSGSISAY